MLIQIDHHGGIPIYRQVIDQVRRQIMIKALLPGDQLDTVRDLAARLKVNPMTVSKAYASLETEGLVERRRGVGLFVANMQTPQKERIKSDLLKDAMEKAAITSIQLDVPQDQAIELFQKLYQQHAARNRRQP